MSEPHRQSTTKPLVLGAIADDLTGGAELASMLVARGVATGFTIGLAAGIDDQADAHVIALKTRVVPSDEAVTLVLAAADKLIARGVRQIFFKYCATFDSTPAGNIGPCAEALMERLGVEQALFCPALCETGRTVYQGHMFGGAQLLSESPKRSDPLTPMTDSNLVRVLQAQSRRTAGLLAHDAVEAGPAAIRERMATLAKDGVALLIADTLAERHLATLARAALDLPLLTGNSSIAAHLPPLWLERTLIGQPAPIRLPGIAGPGAVIAGSVASQTLAQLSEFARTSPVLTLELSRAFAGEDLIGEAIGFAARAIADGRDFAISSATGEVEVARLQAAHGRLEVAARAESILSVIARQIVREHGVRRLIVAGGETSGAVMKALGIDRLAIGPYQGLGMSRALYPGPPPLALALKSGKLGSLDVFERLLAGMCRPVTAEAMLERWPPG